MPPLEKGLIGKIFGRLMTVSEPYRLNNKTYVDCICSCGNLHKASPNKLKSGWTKSCGCLHKEKFHPPIKHGFARASKSHPLYSVYRSMLNRCYNSKCQRFKHYGGRGIVVCKEWKDNPKSFFDWATKNGYAKDLQIDRRNNDGNYEPSNCRFVTRTDNARNKSTTKLSVSRAKHIRILFFISKKKVKDISYLYGISEGHIYHILKTPTAWL